MGINFLFIGLIFVGLLLTVKVVTEGMRQLAEKKDKLAQYRLAAEQCLDKAEADDEKLKLVESEVTQLQKEYEALAEKEKSLEVLIRDLEQKVPKKPRARFG